MHPPAPPDRPYRELELLTPTEAQRLLLVSRSWLYEAAEDGRIPSIRLGGPGRLRRSRDAAELLS